MAERGRVTPRSAAPPLRDLVGVSGGEFACWIKITTPNDRPHIIPRLGTRCGDPARRTRREKCSVTNDSHLGQNGDLAQAAPSTAALRMRRHRERRRDGLRCMTIELRETEIDALIRRGLLEVDARNDLQSVRKAFYYFLERTLGS
jgi:hypothetical protein